MTIPSVLVLITVLGGAPPASDDVRLDFPETVELKIVVDYVAATLGLNVIYDENELRKSVSLRVAEPVPRGALLGIMRSVLRGRGLVLVPAEQTGWLKIIPAEQLAGAGGPLRHDLPPPDGPPTDVVTYVLPVRHADLQAVKTAITPYLSKPGGSVLAVSESELLVITDFVGNVRRAIEIAALFDVTAPEAVIETIAVRHQDPGELADTVTRLLSEQARLESRSQAAPPLSLQPDPLTGDLIAIGLPAQVDEARALVERFGRTVERSSEIYQPLYMTASRMRTLIEQLLPGAKLATDDPSNMLVVTARPEVHEQIAELLERFDTAPPESATPLRLYKLLNRRADDAFATIGMLLMGQAFGAEEGAEPDAESGSRPRRYSGRLEGPGGPTVAAGAIQIPPMPPPTREDPSAAGTARATIQGEGFSLSLDEHTNSIIAIATPEIHRQLEQLIAQLDKRRPQVLVEVTLVSVSVEDGVDLGVELQTQKLDQKWGFELFTSFGLTDLDPTTGARSLNVLPGGTGVLLAPDEVPIIIHALANSGKTQVYSAPRILVDDNATGTIESVAESPFTSVNASDTVATTSFAGFAKAGTQLTIEPHIAEGDHLEINYSLTVSTFTGSGTTSSPPPRSADTITSTIRVPDAHTVVVGGLLTETLGQSSSHLPWIGKVPVLGLLFGTNTESRSKVRLYAFIRPTILRNEDFADLKYISKASLDEAGVDDGFPPDRWQYMR